MAPAVPDLNAMPPPSELHWLDVEGRAHAYYRWLVDRPPPWERDCDCCFKVCPDGHNCLLQSDDLFLACRGESLGSVLDKLWADWPMSVVIFVALILVTSYWWLRQQARVIIYHIRAGNKEANKEEADEDEEESDEEEEESAEVVAKDSIAEAKDLDGDATAATVVLR